MSPFPWRDPPTTRYQGSKRKLLKWIWEHVGRLPFETVLDVFGGSGAVSYLFKAQGKSVTYNDALRFNQEIGAALIENSDVRLTEEERLWIGRRDPGFAYDDFIARTFPGIYFSADENAWLDVVCQNIPRLAGRYSRALAWYALFQACLRKRPYNLFHRSNLSMRTAEVQRGFGNKATWDAPFEDQVRQFVDEANRAVFDSGFPCRALCCDALDVPGRYDLVYLDPPYLNGRGTGVDYFDFYHFLEGMLDYPQWPERINLRRKHRPLVGVRSPWSDPKRNRAAFEALLGRHAESILVVSYRSDGIPSEEELVSLLRRFKTHVTCHCFGEYRYVLSTNRRSQELLLIGQ